MSANGIKAVFYSTLFGLLFWAVTIAGCVYIAG